jgi:hypothetical protein
MTRFNVQETLALFYLVITSKVKHVFSKLNYAHYTLGDISTNESSFVEYKIKALQNITLHSICVWQVSALIFSTGYEL